MIDIYRNGRFGTLIVDGVQATGANEAPGQSDSLNDYSNMYFGMILIFSLS